MYKVFLGKIGNLCRGEDGVALVITLALFMFMYVSCAGVFAIGQAIGDKIALQNACDAAAYSAAVVEADTLSRVATINRAMAWTYKSMVSRQMDYVANKWLSRVCEKYIADDALATSIGSDEPGAYANDRCVTMGPFTNPPKRTFSDIVLAVGAFPGHCLGQTPSFYSGSPDDLEKQIAEDKAMIKGMNEALDDLVDVGRFTTRVRNVAEYVLEANVPPALAERSRWIFKFSADGIFRTLGSLSNDENLFLSYVNSSVDGAHFNETWFKSNHTAAGLIRSLSAALTADWVYIPKGVGVMPPIRDHSYSTDGDVQLEASYCAGQVARPRVLTDRYLGGFNGEDERDPCGTVCIGIETELENPWRRMIKSAASDGGDGAAGGFYDVFTPSRAVPWMYAFSAAKACCRNTEAESYCIPADVNDGTWNLRVHDWDAVFVPVRRIGSKVEGNVWKGAGDDELDFLSKWIGSEGGWLEFRQIVGHPSLHTTPEDWDDDLPTMHRTGDAAAKKIDFKSLVKLMYH